MPFVQRRTLVHPSWIDSFLRKGPNCLSVPFNLNPFGLLRFRAGAIADIRGIRARRVANYDVQSESEFEMACAGKANVHPTRNRYARLSLEKTKSACWNAHFHATNTRILHCQTQTENITAYHCLWNSHHFQNKQQPCRPSTDWPDPSAPFRLCCILWVPDSFYSLLVLWSDLRDAMVTALFPILSIEVFFSIPVRDRLEFLRMGIYTREYSYTYMYAAFPEINFENDENE